MSGLRRQQKNVQAARLTEFKYDSGKFDLNLAHERYRRLWVSDFPKSIAEIDIATLTTNK